MVLGEQVGTSNWNLVMFVLEDQMTHGCSDRRPLRKNLGMNGRERRGPLQMPLHLSRRRLCLPLCSPDVSNGACAQSRKETRMGYRFEEDQARRISTRPVLR